jgi:hypothetical protein
MKNAILADDMFWVELFHAIDFSGAESPTAIRSEQAQIIGRKTAARPTTPAPANGMAPFMALLVETADGLVPVVPTPAVVAVPLTVLTAVLDVSELVVVVVTLLVAAAVTVDWLISVSGRRRKGEKQDRAARTYLSVGWLEAVSVVIAGG